MLKKAGKFELAVGQLGEYLKVVLPRKAAVGYLMRGGIQLTLSTAPDRASLLDAAIQDFTDAIIAQRDIPGKYRRYSKIFRIVVGRS